jgi:hypothetical protein
MEKKLNSCPAGWLLLFLLILPAVLNGQSEKAFIKKYLQKLQPVSHVNALQKYRMTAVYINRDLYGNFTGKTKVTGDYTRGLDNGFVSWTNVYISGSDRFAGTFPEGKNQEYMENMKYIPSPKMLEAGTFKNFPASTDAVFAKNLIWDMMAIEGFAWDYSDSLKLNKTFRIPEIRGEFNMADIGTYTHNNIQLCWTGISSINDELCAVIDYRALDNIIELSLEGFKSKGTEQYWGTTWISLDTKNIVSSVMYSGTIQEIEIEGMADKFLVKTIREIKVDKIK